MAKRDTSDYNKAYNLKNKFEFKLISGNIYSTQRDSSRKRGHPIPEWDLEGLRDWMRLQPQLEKLLKDYKDSGGDRNLIPSVDRRKDHLPYTFDNIQLGTWRENLDKENAKKNKAIIQMTREGEFIKEWTSIKEATKALGFKSHSSISMAVSGIQGTAGGFKWKFAN
jgi:hypothetical protein|tara:strand:+ start:28 stop:528 length:501 start_codon:yes stop_codon:yes gene_type:complete